MYWNQFEPAGWPSGGGGEGGGWMGYKSAERNRKKHTPALVLYNTPLGRKLRRRRRIQNVLSGVFRLRSEFYFVIIYYTNIYI